MLFRIRGRSPKAKPKQESVLTKAWQSLLPTRKTTRGTAFTDFQCAEDMIVALTGSTSGDSFEHERFVAALSDSMAEGVVVYRPFKLHEPAPARVSGGLHLSCRQAQRAREIIGRGESRGKTVPLPFHGILSKRQPTRPIAHGYLVVDRGFELARVEGGVHRTVPSDWPVLDRSLCRKPDSPDLHGCPLVVGDSDVRSSWEHLERYGALAVWSGSLLWLWKLVPGEQFPGPLDLAALARRAHGGIPK